MYFVVDCSKSDGQTNSNIECFDIFEKAEEAYKEIVKDALQSHGMDFAIEMWTVQSVVGLKINFDEDTVIDFVTASGTENQVYTWNTNGQQDDLGLELEDCIEQE